MNTPVRIQIMPGVWLSAIQTRKFKSSFWSVLLLTPLQEDSAAMTALLPRVLNRGTARYPDRRQLTAALEELYGGTAVPVTAKLGEVQATGFQAAFLDDPYVLDGRPVSPAAAELMGDLLLRPATKNGRLRQEVILGERENLTAEIRAQSNDKMRYAARRLNEEMCRGEAYAVDRLGGEAQAEGIRPWELDRHYRRLLGESRVELYYCGSVDADRVAQYWAQALMDIPRKGVAPLGETQWRHRPEELRRVVERQDVTQEKLAIGLRTNTRLDSGEYPALMVANTVLGGAPSSKLFQNVRERQSLCYYAMSTLDCHKGLMGIHAGVAPEQAERAEQAVFDQLHALQDGNLTRQELEAAKGHLCNALRSSMDSHGGLYGFYVDQSQSAAPVTVEEQLARLEQVTAEETVRAAQMLQADTVYLLTGEEERHETA